MKITEGNRTTFLLASPIFLRSEQDFCVTSKERRKGNADHNGDYKDSDDYETVMLMILILKMIRCSDGADVTF